MRDELLQAALTGARGNGAEPLPAETPADALGEGMGLLLRAGLRDVYRQAGYLPSSAPEPFPPAPDVPETVCPPVAEGALREMIERAPSLPSAPREALRTLARRGWVLPPSVLELALSNRLPLSDLQPVLGSRGRWLAGLNEAWQWVLAGEQMPEPPEVERIWAEGKKGDRVALIRRLRETDPDGARERVAAQFASEPADLRQDLVKALEVGLSSADEPFLEAALDDRSKGVRGAAAGLLARLPESAFVGRMVVRAGGFVTRRRLRGSLALHPPSELPENWRRDGIGSAPTRGLTDEWAGAVLVLSSLPASVLVRELDVSLQDVFEAADRYDGTMLIEAWRRNAASGERDALLPLLWDMWWAKPLLRTESDGTLIALAQTMPADMLRQRLLRLLSDPPDGTERFITLVLNELSEPWPSDLSRAVLDLLRRWLDRSLRRDRDAGDWPQLSEPLATHAAPDTIEEALELLAAIERAKVMPDWNGALRRGADVLRLRHRFWNAMAMAMMEVMTMGRVKDDGHG